MAGMMAVCPESARRLRPPAIIAVQKTPWPNVDLIPSNLERPIGTPKKHKRCRSNLDDAMGQIAALVRRS